MEADPWGALSCRLVTGRGSASSQRIRSLLDSISSDLTHIENEYYKVCKNFPNVVPVEIIGDDSYKLEYALPEFLGNFQVTIKHRMICVIGHDPQQQVCDRTYADVRILPDFVNNHRAVWNFQNGKMTVTIPYKYPIEEEMKRYCNRDIDDTLIHVSRGYYINPSEEEID
ncbi:hypothetical protein K1T71_001591 [Dendrolimus kikuchii]|uniref:Uncharacterized protein n=1 Tax=Dendrolimus kikuchii TaxID=765133 RepID=A0ACC1DEA7_9NEOP|nr:hypothetical protein K1T71_001591 [Dendrolimus kikuchii]